MVDSEVGFWGGGLDHRLDETSNFLSYSNYSLTVGHFNLFLLSEAEKNEYIKTTDKKQSY